MSEVKNNEPSKTVHAWIPVSLAVIILLVGVMSLAIKPDVSSSTTETDPPAKQQHSSCRGHTSAAIAFAGTLLLFAAFLMQRKELELQRWELGRQRRELEHSREIAMQQVEALRGQTTELQRQNELAFKRDAMQIVLGLMRQTETLEPQEESCRPIQIAGLRYILETASHSPTTAHELLRVYSAALAQSQTTPEHWFSLIELLCPKLSPPPDATWLDEAKRIIRHVLEGDR